MAAPEVFLFSVDHFLAQAFSFLSLSPLLRPGWLVGCSASGSSKNPQQFQVKHKSISEFPSVLGGEGSETLVPGICEGFWFLA